MTIRRGYMKVGNLLPAAVGTYFSLEIPPSPGLCPVIYYPLRLEHSFHLKYPPPPASVLFCGLYPLCRCVEPT